MRRVLLLSNCIMLLMMPISTLVGKNSNNKIKEITEIKNNQHNLQDGSDAILVAIKRQDMKIKESFSGTVFTPQVRSYGRNLLRWKDYSKTWNKFYYEYKYIYFGGNSLIRVYNANYVDSNNPVYEISPIISL